MSKHERSSPRAMPMETIITRFKSRQKLLEPNKKNTSKSVKINKKVNKKRGKSKQIVTVTQEKKETYPKFKKKVVNKISFEKKTVKKIVLAPKHCYTLIGGLQSCNKRKLHTPRKEISFVNEEEKERRTKEQEPNVLQLVEDCGSLDEEDLLEILTCPSPVWWEDPPDGYIEEPIFSSPQPQYEQKSIKTQLLEERNKEENQVTKVELSSKKVDDSIPLEINVVNRDSTFINKRSKLELLLGNIKNRKRVNKNTKNKKKIKAKRKKGRKENLNPLNKNKNDKLDQNDKRRDSLNLSDLGDDEILNHLENIDIPMYDNIHKDDDDDRMSAEYLDMTLFDDEFDLKNDKVEEVIDKTKNALLINEINDNDIAEEVINKTNDSLLTNNVNDNDIAEEVIEEIDDDLLSNDINDNDISEEVIDETNDNLLSNDVNDNDISEQVIDKTNEVLHNDIAEEVTNKNNDGLLSNEVLDNDIADEVVDKTNDEILTNEIKDNNIAEEVIDITDDDDDPLINEVIKAEEINDKGLLINAVNDNDKVEKLNDEAQGVNDKVEGVNCDDLLTVYKVIDNDPNKLQIIIPKTGNDKIDNYYKQMKKINKVMDKSIMISEADAIRYCFVCSSIFDTENCGYCDKKKEYSCDICGMRVNAKSDMIKHLHEHINGVSK